RRPHYIHQVPLDFIPGVGPKTLEKLLAAFGTEMRILHDATFEEITMVVGRTIAKRVLAARSGQLSMTVGGGGQYGRIHREVQEGSNH
ncbi:MAG: TIGR00375 family protein, partial [Firmicutes bacterium]|nr:TIGR00375 family protein [Bacillota bacterium]